MQGKGSATRRNKADSKKEVLVGVRVPESFHRRILSEGRRRELTIKEMVTYALKVFFRNPLDWDAATTVYFHAEHEETASEQLKLMQLWTKYLNHMPQEKVELMTRAMEWDLTMLKSSRRKPTSRGRGSR